MAAGNRPFLGESLATIAINLQALFLEQKSAEKVYSSKNDMRLMA
jgi:hypothetical protein